MHKSLLCLTFALVSAAPAGAAVLHNVPSHTSGPAAVRLRSVSTAVNAEQDTASSFDQLRVLVKSDDTVTVTDRDGRVVRGLLQRVSSTTIELRVKDQLVSFMEGDVTTIKQRRQDSLANGAKAGFTVGVVLGGLAVLAAGEFGHHAGFAVSAMVGEGLFFAGLGVAVDAMVPSSTVIFSKPAGSARVSLSPIHTHSDRGLRVAWRF